MKFNSDPRSNWTRMVFDEKTHNINRAELQNIAIAHTRIVSLTARVAKATTYMLSEKKS
jgi:hypothetical protein